MDEDQTEPSFLPDQTEPSFLPEEIARIKEIHGENQRIKMQISYIAARIERAHSEICKMLRIQDLITKEGVGFGEEGNLLVSLIRTRLKDAEGGVLDLYGLAKWK